MGLLFKIKLKNRSFNYYTFLLGCLPEAELSGSLQQRHHSHVSQQVLHGCISLNVPLGGRFADPGGIIVPLHNQSAV